MSSIIERPPLRVRPYRVVNLRSIDALNKRVARTFSQFPGVSRAGTAILVCVPTNLSRITTTDYAFLSALPLLIATTFHELFKNHYLLQAKHFLMLAAGFVMSMVIALIVVKIFIRVVARHHFTSSSSFRIDLGLVALAKFH